MSQITDYCFKQPFFSCALAFSAVYSAYYFLFVRKKPCIFCKDERFTQFLLKHCPILGEKYCPTFWCFGSRTQTIIRSLLKSSPFVNYESEIIKTPDNGQIKLDWYQNETPAYPDDATRPTVVFLPGLTGSSADSYVKHIVLEAAKHGFRTVVFNNRGNGGAQLLTSRTYCAVNSEDMELVVSHITKKYPKAPKIGAGISLGAMILLHYLIRSGKDSKLLAGMTVSVPWNTNISVESLETPLNKYLLNRQLTQILVEKVKGYKHLFEDHFDIPHVLQSSTIREFDDRFTAKQFGFQSSKEYYDAASLYNKIHQLQTPVLCLNAEDDMFAPKCSLPVNEAQENDNIALVVTSYGGHIGYLEGLLPFHAGYMDRVFSQFANAIFNHYQDLKKD